MREEGSGNNSKSSDQKKTAPSHKEQLTNMQATNNLYYGGHQNVIDVIMGNKEGQTRYLQIGNRQYICNEMNNTKSSIFFDGEQFLLRNAKKSAELTPLFQRTSGSTLIYESMYPDVTLDSDYSQEFSERLSSIVGYNIINDKPKDGDDF